jgi:hypothetical protein
MLKAIMLHRIGMRLNQENLMKAGENEFSKMWFLNANTPYCTIYVADLYQDECMDEAVKKDKERTQCIIKDEKRLTSGESFDYVFEEENKALKGILGPNPTFDDFRVATLVKDEAQCIVKEVKERYQTRCNASPVAGLPNYQACMITIRQVFRMFVDDPKCKRKLQSLSGEELNSKLVQEFDHEASRRRKVFIEEIKNNGKFTKAPHEEKRFEVKTKKPTFEEKNKEAMDKIYEEEDTEIKMQQMKILITIVLMENKDKRLTEIIKFIDDISNAV